LRIVFYLIVLIAFSDARAGSYEDFFIAVKRGDERTVAQLLARGFDPNSLAENGQTGLILALNDGHDRVAEVLIRSPQLAADTLNANGETALMIAALRGRLDWVERLLARGAKVHREGWSPIHYAATGPDVRIVQLLLSRGAPVDPRSPDADTPLMMAARYGAEDSVALLLARGASATARNRRDMDAVDMARAAGREYLVERLQESVKR
jgi:uncharacterized protein